MAIRFKDAQSSAGAIRSALASVTAAFSGTHALAPGRTGTIVRQLQGVTSAFVGQFTSNSNRLGVIGSQLANVTAQVIGAIQAFFFNQPPTQSLQINADQTINLKDYSPGAVSISITAGTLPAGLTLDTTTGVISGVPTTLQTNITVEFEATDEAGTVTPGWANGPVA